MKKVLCMLLAVVMVFSLVACSGGKTAPTDTGGNVISPDDSTPGKPTPTAPTVLRVSRGEDVTTWDPYNNTGIVLIMLGKLIYNNLIQMDPQGNFLPDLATEWSANDDATEWTFKLREGVSFSDGTAFNAEAVKISLERYLNETLSNGNLWSSFIGVDVVDETTCVLKFSTPNGSLPNTLTETPMLNPTTIKEKGADGLIDAIGTGPYMLESWDIGSKIVLKKNPSYWGDPPSFETIEYYVIQEDSTRLAAVQTGDIDIADQIPADLVATIGANDPVQIKRINGQDNMFLGLKCDTPPFDDVNARLAVLYGINRQSLVDNVVLGGQTVRGIMPEGTMGYSEDFPEIKYDPEYAKGLLAKTSYNGEELEFIAPIGWYVKQSEQCQAIIADLKEVGFNIKLTMLEGATFSSTRNNGIYSIYTTGCAHPASDPNLFLSQRVKGDSAKSGYVNEELNAKIDEAASNADPIKRQELYEQVVQVMLDNAAPMIPLFQWERIYAVSDKIDLDASADTFRSDLRMDLRFVVFK